MAKKIEDVLFGVVPAEKFEVTDENSLAWALRKLKQAEKQIQGATEKRGEWIQKINEWYGEETREAVNTIERMNSLIREYHMKELEKNPKRKTIKHPLGDLTARRSSKVEVQDVEAFIKWAKESGHKDWVRVKEEPNKADIKKHVKSTGAGEAFSPITGELVPGIKVEETTNFKVILKEDE